MSDPEPDKKEDLSNATVSIKPKLVLLPPPSRQSSAIPLPGPSTSAIPAPSRKTSSLPLPSTNRLPDVTPMQVGPRGPQQAPASPLTFVLQGVSSTLESVKQQLSGHRIDGCLWLMRLLSLCFTCYYALPNVGFSSRPYFYHALSAGALAHGMALLLRRLSAGSSPREVLYDDDFHYLVYCTMFLRSDPNLGILIPPFLSTFVQASAFSLSLLESMLLGSASLANSLRQVQDEKREAWLLAIAYCEILLFPFLTALAYSGRFNIKSLFLVALFLYLRFNSRANPFSRQAFHHARELAEHHLVNNAFCPSWIRQLVKLVIEGLIFVSLLGYDSTPQ